MHWRSASACLPLAAVLLASACALAGDARAAGNEANESYAQAKRWLEREVYADHRVTVYCGYAFDARKQIAIGRGFFTPKHGDRALRMEWEHSVPAENFGRAFVEWREGAPQCTDSRGRAYRGRRCAQTNLEFRRMEADMYNLYPSVGAVNALRSNFRYDELPGEDWTFGSCPMKVDVRGRRAEPPDSAKGALARSALYMDESYQRYSLSRAQRRLMEAWDRMHPVDQWECTRALRIEALQGNPNRFVKTPCLEAGLWRNVRVPVSAPEADPQWQARHAGSGADGRSEARRESRPRPAAVLRFTRMLRSYLGRALSW